MSIFAFIQKRRTSYPLTVVFLCLTSLTVLSQKPELILQNAHNTGVLSVAISKDKKIIASAGAANDVRIWDADSGTMLRSFAAPQISALTFSPHARLLVADYIAGLGESEIMSIWDVQNGKPLVDARRIASYAFSDDDQTVTICYQPDMAKQEEPDYISVLKDLTGHGSDRVAKCAGGPVEDKKTKPAVANDQREMSPDGKTFLTTEDILSGKGRIIVHDAATGNEIIRFEDIAFGAAKGLAILQGSPYAFSADGALLVIGKNDGTLLMWNAQDRATVRSFSPSPVAIVKNIEFSPTGQSVTAYGSESMVDLGTGESGPMINGPKADEYTVTTGDAGRELHDTKTGKFLRSLSGFDTCTFSKTQRYFALERAGLIEIWQTYPNVLRKAFKSDDENPDLFTGFSPDETMFTTTGFSTQVWDAQSGQLKWQTPGGLSRGRPTFSSDSKFVAITEGGTQHAETTIYRTASGKVLLPVNHSAANRKADGVDMLNLDDNDNKGVGLFSDDDRLFAISKGALVGVYDLSTFRSVASVIDNYGAVPMRFSADKKKLITQNSQGELVFWSLSGKRSARLASAFIFAGKEWLVTTTDGLFDGTPNAWKQLIWRFDGNTFSHAPVEAFFKEFYYPGLLKELLQGKRPKPPAKDLSKIDIRQPKVEIATIDGKPIASQTDLSTANRKVNVQLKVTDNKEKARLKSTTSTGAQDLRLFRNGSLVKAWHGDVLKGRDSVELEVTIPIVAGENRLTAYAFNHDNVKSGDATVTVNGADSLGRKGVAYILAVGVNKYANTNYDLTYAVADAEDFGAELKRQQDKLGNYARVEVIKLIDQYATKANILKALSEIAPKIQPEDSLTIYFAGHGTAQQNRFYLIPHDLGYTGKRDDLDAAGMQAILSHSISDEEIEHAIEGIDAGQLLLVIDACNSGQALEAEEKRRGPMNSKGLAQLAYEKGMYILTAAQSYQAAQEAAKLGHGFLTYALVEEGLKTAAADREPKDGKVMLREWLDYATMRVPQMQEDDLVHRQLTQGPSKRTAPADTENVQRPRVFYRRETEPHPMVVARP